MSRQQTALAVNPARFSRPEVQISLQNTYNQTTNALSITISVEEAKQLKDQAEPVSAKVRELFSQYRPALEQGNAERERAAAILESVREKFAAYQRQG
jgi:hypothetical protein